MTSASHLIDTDIIDFAHGGFGIGRSDDGAVVFVRGALPGETVRCAVYETKKTFRKARVVDVLHASPYRIVSAWDAGRVGVTGAADLSHTTIGFQHELKRMVIENQIARIGGNALHDAFGDIDLIPHDLPGTTADGWHTRTRFDAVVMETGLGMYGEHSHELVSIENMPLAVPAISDGGFFRGELTPYFSPGERVHVVAPNSSEAIVSGAHGIYAISSTSYRRVPPRKHSKNGHIDYTIKQTIEYDGRSYTYRLSPQGFWQIHYAAPQALTHWVLSYADVMPGDHVFELFSGAGLFSLPVARAVGSAGVLLTIEGSVRAVRDARDNLAGYPWVHALQGWIGRREVIQALNDVNPRVIIADPPRAGLGIAVASILAASSAERIVLVHCDPASMARDTSVFVEHGWRINEAVVLDLFPNTHHVETMCLLTKR